MATTLTLIPLLADGVKDSSGNAIASGKVYLYDPSTTNEQTVYQDSAGASAYTQPITLDSQGRKTVWALSPCRLVVKSSDEVTTHYDIDPVATIRAEQVYITNTQVNGGTQTTLDAAFTSEDFTSYQEDADATTPAATSRSQATWNQETHIIVTDYGAAGDGTTDDATDIQQAIDRALAADRTDSERAHTVSVRIPAGTWKISAALTAAVASGTKQLRIYGDGPKATILSQTSATADGLHLNYTSATDVRTLIEGIGVTCATNSSGAGFKLTNADKVTIRNCESGKFRTGFDASGATESRVYDCEIVSTDNNAACVGINVGANSKVRDCIVADSAGNNGTGIKSTAAGVQVTGCEVAANFATPIDVSGARSRVRENEVSVPSSGTGISMTGANSRARDNYVTGSSATTGISLGAAKCVAEGNHVTGFTTGVSVGAVDGCRVVDNDLPSNTTDISVNASATNTVRRGNIGDEPVIDGQLFEWKAEETATSGGSVTPTWRGDVVVVNRYVQLSGSGGVTVNATSTTGLQAGTQMKIVYDNETGSSNTITFGGTQYVAYDGGTTMTQSVANTAEVAWHFVYDGTKWRPIHKDIGNGVFGMDIK